MEERDDVELRKRKAESDRLFLLYQKEKERQRNQDAQTLSQIQLKQAVSNFKSIQLNEFKLKI